MLLCLLLIPAGVVAARAIEDRRRRRAAALLGSGMAGISTAGAAGAALGRRRARRSVRAVLPGALLVVAFVLLVVALARPQATVALPRPEGTLMLTFDVSGSMAATDVQPTRLDTAKAVATSIVQRQPPGVVIGLVAFSDAGITVKPPSSNQADVLAAINSLAPARGTSVGQGILATLDAITKASAATPPDYYSNRSPAPTVTPAPVPPGSDASTAIVLLSDGENNERPDPLQAAQLAASRGIRIEVIGIGSATGADLDLNGFRVHTALDSTALQQIADVTAGSYHEADDDASIAAIYDSLQPKLVVRSEPLEVTALFAAAGITLLAVGAVLSLAWTGRLP
jgi:Ca-activated chloride channel family protein